jgi:hypothetical protein
MQYPTINGHRYSFASIELTIGTKRFIGFKGVDYSDELDPGIVRGAHAQPLGRTKGDYTAEASLTMLKEEWDELLATLGNGYLEIGFPITACYAEDGLPTNVDKLIGCRIKKVSDSHSQGNDGLEIKLDLSVMYITRNGRTPLRKMLPQK